MSFYFRCNVAKYLIQNYIFSKVNQYHDRNRTKTHKPYQLC